MKERRKEITHEKNKDRKNSKKGKKQTNREGN